MMQIFGGTTPHYERVMGFIDGSNFLIELARELEIQFRADKPPLPALEIAQALTNPFFDRYGTVTIRKYWFGSYQGDETYFRKYAGKLRELTFEPVLFKNNNGKEKGVDIALATEMLVNAFNQNYDVGVIVAGDKDYVGLVKEVKRYGPIIVGSFFKHGLSDDFALAVDSFSDITQGVNVDSERYKRLISEVEVAQKSER